MVPLVNAYKHVAFRYSVVKKKWHHASFRPLSTTRIASCAARPTQKTSLP